MVPFKTAHSDSSHCYFSEECEPIGLYFDNINTSLRSQYEKLMAHFSKCTNTVTKSNLFIIETDCFGKKAKWLRYNFNFNSNGIAITLGKNSK